MTELSPLERGVHALGFVVKGKHGQSVEAYAKAGEVAAAELFSEIGHLADSTGHSRRLVMQSGPDIGTEGDRSHNHLAELHAAPRWLWRALVAKLIAPTPKCLSNA